MNFSEKFMLWRIKINSSVKNKHRMTPLTFEYSFEKNRSRLIILVHS